jgi:hypothetical protein
MSNSFIGAMNNVAETENGAVSYKSTQNPIIDWFFASGALRNETDDTRIIDLFDTAFAQDPQDALRILFYTRDIRGGQGERRVFRVLIKHLAVTQTNWLLKNLELVPFYGRWDDLLELLDVPKVANQVRDFLLKQLDTDLENLKKQNFKDITLCAKWMPSENASSKTTKKYARALIGLNSKRDYRKKLSELRKHLNIVEIKLTSKNFSSIEYEKVPSKATLKYKEAFKRNDTARYTKYINDLQTGKTKINTSTLYPYDIVRQYQIQFGWGDSIHIEKELDQTLELAWKNLPDFVPDISGIVVADTSGSMSGLPMDISISLAIYVAERNKNKTWKNYTIPFSSKATWIELKGKSLLDNIKKVYTGDCSNTNLQSVFNLILKRAKAESVAREDMPKVIIVISDMEFDIGVEGDTNLETIKQKYATAGYALPKLVWWNVQSRNNQVPAREKDNCLFLSGANPVCLKYALSGEYNAIEAIKELINRERYQRIIFFECN